VDYKELLTRCYKTSLKKMEAIKAILVNIKENLKKQADNWRNN